MFKKLLLITCCGLSATLTTAQTVVELNPEKDNSIYSESTNSNGVGQLYVGTTCTDNFRRALLEFDITDMVPAGATITDAVLHLNLNTVSPDAGTQDYNLHRVNNEWGEGTSFGTGTGGEPTTSDATWEHAMFDTEDWDDLGGDFSETVSATAPVSEALGDYSWTSPTLIENVQNWLDYPMSNHGWILIGDEEGTCNARRFGSKDDGVAPILEITYECISASPKAICNSLNVYLNSDGEATITGEDLDGGSVAVCEGDVTFDASISSFSCEDITTYEPQPSLVISAVFDGPLTGGVPKGVEIYVINDIEDLSIYGVGFANNGGGSDGIEFTFPAVSAMAGQYLYVASENSGFTDWFGFESQYVDGDASINGDDAIELFMGDEVIDVFGEIDVDGSGTAWDYLDGWARRVSETGPDGDVFNIDNWTFSGINEWDGESSNASAVTPLEIATFKTAPTIGIPAVLTVTDEEGLESTCYAPIMVFDTLGPNVSCVDDFTVVLDASGMVEFTADDFDAGTTDGCGLESISISTTSLSCSDEGENEIMLYATDIYGNIDSCSTIVTIDASEVVSIATAIITDPSCADTEDGAIDLAVTGGSGDYTYDWDNDGTGDDDDTEDLADLVPGTYAVEIMDENGCSTTGEYELIGPDPILLNVEEVTDETCPGSLDGEIIIVTTGGTPDYVFDWTKAGDPDFTGDTEDLTDLGSGEYAIMVTDEGGCTAEETVEVAVENTFDLTVVSEFEVVTSAQEDAAYQWLDCDNDYAIIDGATEQAFYPTADGNYACELTIEGGCKDTTACVPFAFSSIDENAMQVSVYPNPTNGKVQLIFEQTHDLTVFVSDINGRQMMTFTSNEQQLIIDLSAFENGVYFIELNSTNARSIQRIILNK